MRTEDILHDYNDQKEVYLNDIYLSGGMLIEFKKIDKKPLKTKK